MNETGRLLFPQVTDWEKFTHELFSIVRNSSLTTETAEEIRHHVLNFVNSYSLQNFSSFSDQTYVRNYVGKDPLSGWEVLVMSWKKGNRTAIHGHPQYAGYTFTDGEFQVEIFESNGKEIHKIQDILIHDVQSLYALGKAGRFDNHIHRITCLSGTAHSLHIYSDDALKGIRFEETGRE